jgi:hypothetical protein
MKSQFFVYLDRLTATLFLELVNGNFFTITIGLFTKASVRELGDFSSNNAALNSIECAMLRSPESKNYDLL